MNLRDPIWTWLASTPFVQFGRAHLVVVVVVLAVIAGGIRWGRSRPSPRAVRFVAIVIAVLLVASELAYYALGFAKMPWQAVLRDRLPLHICGASVYLLAWTLVWPTAWVFEVSILWALLGTLPAVVFPDLTEDWPSLAFLQFFVNHGLVVIAAVYALAVQRQRVRRSAWWRVFALTNVYMLIVAGANMAVSALIDAPLREGANYMFLCRAPETAAPLFFLPWPWYILMLEPLVFAAAWGLCRVLRASRRSTRLE